MATGHGGAESASLTEVDWIEAGRQAHQLEARHGRDAWKFAERLADSAMAQGRLDEAAFWRAVAGSLKPR